MGDFGKELTDDALLKLCLVLCLIGLVVVSFSEAPLMRVSKLSKELVGQKVILRGTVSSKQYLNTTLFLDVSSERVVVFPRYQKNSTQFFIGDTIEAEGVVSSYDGKLELIGEALRLA